MRKITKIFAILLTLCLLFGAMVSVVASATEQVVTNESLSVSGHERNTSWTFTDDKGNPVKWGSGASTGTNMIFGVVTSPSGNDYLQIASDGILDSATTWDAYVSKPGVSLEGVTYFTFDYEFGTDRYVYWLQDKDAKTGELLTTATAHTYEIDKDGNLKYEQEVDKNGNLVYEVDAEGKTKVDEDGNPVPKLNPIPITSLEQLEKLEEEQGFKALKVLPAYGTTSASYNNAMRLGFGSGNSSQRSYVKVLYDSTNGRYYVSTFDSNKGKIYLSNELGVFDHITVVTKISSDFKTLDEYIYVNGEYLGHQQKVYTTAITQIHSLRPRLFTDGNFIKNSRKSLDSNGNALTVDGATLYEGDSFSRMYDNFAINLYKSGSGLDDFFAKDQTELKEPIYNCEDVLYHDYKLSPNGYIDVDGVIASSKDRIKELLKNIKNESHIIATFDILDFDVPYGVDRFTVDAKSFTLSEESAEEYLIIDNLDGTYLVRKATASDGITMHYMYKNGTEDVLLKKSILFTGKAPNTSAIVVPVYDLESDTVTKYTYSDWMIDIDGDFPNINLYDPEPLRALEVLEVALIYEEFGGVLKAYANDTAVGEPIDVSADVPDDIALVKWYAPDGELLSASCTMAGSAVSPCSLDGLVNPVNSAWYDVECKWVNTTAQAASEDSFVTVGGCVNEFVATPTLVADIDAMMNMSYWSHFSINLHLPTEEGIVFLPTEADGETGFFSQALVRITDSVGVNNKIVYNGKVLETYYVQDFPSTDTFDDYVKVVKFIVSEYDLNGDGNIQDNEKNISLEQTFRLNDLEYATKVAKSYACGSEELKLIYAYVNYKYEVYKSIAVENEFSERAEELFGAFFTEVAKHGESCTCAVDYTGVNELFTPEEIEITEESYAELSGANAVVGISYVLDVSKPAISIYVAKDTAFTPEITVKYLNNITGIDDNYAVVSAPVEDTVDGIECLRYDLIEIAAENINSVFEITVKIGDDEYTGRYCLAEYIEKQPTVTLAKVYYAYANACKNYAKAIKEQYDVSDYGVVVEY